jgi:acyl-CoA dehydrogenase
MLMEMRAKTAAARALCLATAAALDRYHRLDDAEARRVAHEEASMLTPVAKAFSTDIGIEVASLGVQIHGGMGFVEETGAAQHYRDARILAIYEGTNGIQSIDLVTRKLPLADGQRVHAMIAAYRVSAERARDANDPALKAIGLRIVRAVEALARATAFLQGALKNQPNLALAGATPYLRLYALAAGGAYLADQAVVAVAERRDGGTDPRLDDRVRDARFFAENVAVAAEGLETTVIEGADAINSAFTDAAA